MFLLSSLRRSFSRVSRHTLTERQPIRLHWVQIKNFLYSEQLLECDTLLDHLDDVASRENPLEHMRLLTNKVITQYQLRKYGNMEMTLINHLSSDSMSTDHRRLVSKAKLQLFALHFIYERNKRQNYNEVVEGLFSEKEDVVVQAQARYFHAMSSVVAGEYQPGTEALIDLINHEFPTSIYKEAKLIEKYKQMAFISLITIRLLSPSSSPSEASSLKFVKDYINAKRVDSQSFKDCDPWMVYNHYNEYQELFPQETKHYQAFSSKLHALFALQCLFQKDYFNFYKQLQRVKDNIFHPYLMGLKYLDQTQSDMARPEFTKVAEHDDTSPEYDILKYEVMGHLELTYKSEGKTEAATDIRQEAEEFKVLLGVEDNTEHLPYLVIPVGELFRIEDISL